MIAILKKRLTYAASRFLAIEPRTLATLKRTFGTVSSESCKRMEALSRFTLKCFAHLFKRWKHIFDDALFVYGARERVKAEQARHAMKIVCVGGELIDTRQNLLIRPRSAKLFGESSKRFGRGLANCKH